ncbi:gene transfer agent family protein [Alteriqipengyuania flavescens]|uniref:gene transfer agent family protein n=1 Tax=Alteriqipengyuania flavescens TaxID=3053610 RepID=UPI0025B52D63|nr:gene transfer agent family protein [Alteriqipengyuania flavescens]WJY19451.1 gene transfer agent family protein [Alteriqipengyuania flavescens]WJY25393.1 gene transfer agent family protein [Alteriqipengyuania flavescens]
MRGEAEIVVGARTLVLRPSFTALVAAEEELGSLFALVERAGEGRLALSEMATLFWHCLPTGDRPDREAVGEAVMAMGLAAAAKPLRTLLGQVLQGRA